MYIRRGTSTEEANNDELQKIINVRIETGYSTRREMNLQAHLKQLQLLIDKVEYKAPLLFSNLHTKKAAPVLFRQAAI